MTAICDQIDTGIFDAVLTVTFNNIARDEICVWVCADRASYDAAIVKLTADKNCDVLQSGPSHVAR